MCSSERLDGCRKIPSRQGELDLPLVDDDEPLRLAATFTKELNANRNGHRPIPVRKWTKRADYVDDALTERSREGLRRYGYA